jgi:hypothetical protein
MPARILLYRLEMEDTMGSLTLNGFEKWLDMSGGIVKKSMQSI